MMVAPLKFRRTDDGSFVNADDTGMFFRSDEAFIRRYALNEMTEGDLSFLSSIGSAFHTEDELSINAFGYRWAKRLYLPSGGSIDYVILVPTLRCNLACGYCQVSRVNEGTAGYDWDEETLAAALRFLDDLETDSIKIEFQGGEPLLRLDILKRVRDHCRRRFASAQFVVCTNLQAVSDEAWAFLAADDTIVSTSLDSTPDHHMLQRTLTAERNEEFLRNLRTAISRFGGSKVSALPTIDIRNLPEPRDVIDSFVGFGLRSIYLRPVNYQGFARKRYDSRSTSQEWNSFHAEFMSAAIEHNWDTDEPVEEYYFSHCLRRVLRPGADGHTDLRNPSLLGKSFIVIDYDGQFYPTDEARMVTRVGQLDLSMGNVRTGLASGYVDNLNQESLNAFHPDCIHCPYQAYCGVDLVDDLSRYGRIDMPKHLTDFCQRHLHIFDLVFKLLYSDDPKVKKSLAAWAGVNAIDTVLTKVLA